MQVMKIPFVTQQRHRVAYSFKRSFILMNNRNFYIEVSSWYEIQISPSSYKSIAVTTRLTEPEPLITGKDNISFQMITSIPLCINCSVISNHWCFSQQH
ncbi:hypothetical protein FKM82_019742 [Ascaphus truei]